MIKITNIQHHKIFYKTTAFDLNFEITMYFIFIKYEILLIIKSYKFTDSKTIIFIFTII